MDTYKEFCIRFWESTRHLDLYSMDGTQLDKLIVDALLKTNGGKELIKTSTSELSVLIKAINHNNRKIQQPSLPDNLDEAAHDYAWEKQDMVYDAEGEILMDYGPRYDAFKAGAEWMAGQGYAFETIMQEDDVDELVPTCPDMYNHGYSCGDKVIVQVRKKQ